VFKTGKYQVNTPPQRRCPMKHRRTVILLVLSMLSSVVSAGIVWDGKLWFYSDDPSGLFVNADGDLEWNPEGGEQFITRIPDMALSQVGDVVEISFLYVAYRRS
jgi:hypothetical protein